MTGLQKKIWTGCFLMPAASVAVQSKSKIEGGMGENCFACLWLGAENFLSPPRPIFLYDPVIIESFCYRKRANQLIKESKTTGWLNFFWTGPNPEKQISKYKADARKFFWPLFIQRGAVEIAGFNWVEYLDGFLFLDLKILLQLLEVSSNSFKIHTCILKEFELTSKS